MTCMRTRQSVPVGRALLAIGLIAPALLVLDGCGRGFEPRPIDESPVMERSQTQEKSGVRVTTAVPSAKETHALFGSKLYRRGVQPVWLEIENQRDELAVFLPVGLDSAYFSPIEAANLNLGDDLSKVDLEKNAYFLDRSMPVNIPPGETRSGFLFTQLEEGTKAFNVDIVFADESAAMTFFVSVPGLRIDHYSVDFDHIYQNGFTDLETEELIQGLENDTPATVTDKKQEGTGDPLNLVLIGEPDDIYYAFLRAGWDETETIYRASLLKTIGSFLTGGEYRYSPVSALFVFGRPQDIALQRARHTIHERNHLRLWMSSYRYEGKPIWLGQISRDIGVRFTPKTITTHKIDANVDETREYLLENLAYAQSLKKYAYVGGVGEAPYDEPRGNLTGDPYFTDGYRLVLWVTSTPSAIDDIEFVEWRIPPHERASGTGPR
jgi:hypothetical protein